MNGWETYYLKGTGKALEEQLFDLVRAGALFYHAGELLPFPTYTYGNMYDRLTQLENDKEDIEKHFGTDIWDNHKQVVEKAKPELLTVENPDEKSGQSLPLFQILPLIHCCFM